MTIARVLTIGDGGGEQGDRYLRGAVPVPPPPPPVVSAQAASEESGSGRVMPGQTTSRVSVQVDFALREK